MPEERRRECNGLLPLHVSPGSPRRGRSPHVSPLKHLPPFLEFNPSPPSPSPEVRQWLRVTKAHWQPPVRTQLLTHLDGPSWFASLE